MVHVVASRYFFLLFKLYCRKLIKITGLGIVLKMYQKKKHYRVARLFMGEIHLRVEKLIGCSYNFSSW